MSFQDILRALRRGSLLVVLCAALGAVAGAAFAQLQTPVYVAGSQLFLGASDEAEDGVVTRQDTAYLQQRMQSYAAVLGSPLLGERVATRLGLTTSGAAIAAEVSVEVPAETVLLNVEVRDESAERAQQIANALGDVFSAVLAELEDTPGSGVDAVEVTILRPAALPAAPDAPSTTVLITAGLLLGLAVGVAVAFAREAFDNRVRDEDDLIELGLVPLGWVPARPTGSDDEPGRLTAHRREALRPIRALLVAPAAHRTPGPEVVTVVSTTALAQGAAFACDLATVSAAAQVPTLLIDADLDQPRAAVLLGLAHGAPGLAEALTGAPPVQPTLQQGPQGLSVLPAGGPAEEAVDLLGGPRTVEVIEAAATAAGADLAVLLTAPLDRDPGAVSLAALGDRVILVVHPKDTRRELRRAVSQMTALGVSLVGAALIAPGGRGRSPAARVRSSSSTAPA